MALPVVSSSLVASGTDWSTISALATAGGTLVLAIATYASVRSANRAARTAERALELGLRPVLFPTRYQDDPQKVTWMDDHVSKLTGGRGSIEVADEVIYMSMGLRNVGSGIAVLHGWFPLPGLRDTAYPPTPLEDFRRLGRDLYVPPGDIGFWQGAIREADDQHRDPLAKAIANRERIIIDLLYGDLEGGQRTISRFSLVPIDDDAWLVSVGRHWNIDGTDPR